MSPSEPPEPDPAMRTRVGTSLLVCVIATALTSCRGADPAQEDASCNEVEARDFPTLERSAEQGFALLEFSVSRVSRCEDQGIPAAQLLVQVTDWHQRNEVRRHLEQAGWLMLKDGSRLSSPDGSVTAQPVTVGSGDSRAAGAYLYMSD